MKCPKCQNEMEEGIALPTNAFNVGMGVGLSWGTGVNKLTASIKNRRDATTYRCKNCGYLESYAK